MRRVLFIVAILALVLSELVPLVKGASYKYVIKASGKDNYGRIYLPATKPSPGTYSSSNNFTKNSINDIKYYDYNIPVRCSYDIEDHHSSYHCKVWPYIRFYKVINKKVSSSPFINVGRGDEGAKWITLYPGEGLYVDVHSGYEKYLGSSTELVSKATIEYGLDTAPPTAPGQFTLKEGNQFIGNNDLLITNCRKVEWGAATDNGSSFYHYNVKSGLADEPYYYAITNRAEITSKSIVSGNEWIPNRQIGLPEEDGTYYLHVKAIDKADNHGPYNTLKLAVDRSVLPIEFTGQPHRNHPRPHRPG